MGQKFIVSNNTALAATISTSTSKKTIVKVTAGARGATIYEVAISFDGATSTNPRVAVECSASTTVASGSGNTAALTSKLDRNDARSLTVTASENYTSEPTYTAQTVLWADYIPPYTPFVYRLPIPLVLGPTEVFTIQTTVGTAANVKYHVVGEEN